jgi:hypothetical protein
MGAVPDAFQGADFLCALCVLHSVYSVSKLFLFPSTFGLQL